MAFRGRGRGRGRGFGRGRGGGGGFDRFGKPEPFILFPEDVEFPPFPKTASTRDATIAYKRKLESFWRSSCYHLEDASDKSHDCDWEIERYSDRFKQNVRRRRENLVFYLKLIPSNFPTELIQGSKRPQGSQKKLRWDRDVDSERLELLEKLESSGKSKNDEGKEKKEDDDEDDEQLQEAEDGSSDDGDYNQNRDFDDDEDDLNMEEEPDEDTYE